LMTFLVVTLKTQVFTVTTNAQNTTTFPGGKCPQNISFFSKGAHVSWHNGQSKPGLNDWEIQDCEMRCQEARNIAVSYGAKHISIGLSFLNR